MTNLPYRELFIWKKGMDVCKKSYELSSRFPTEEKFGLTSQIRRAAVSIPSNIAEGSQRGTDRDFAHFISIARGSLAELETQLILANDIEILNITHLQEILQMTNELSKMLRVFHQRLQSSYKIATIP
jgi:four helix bundle protein